MTIFATHSVEYTDDDDCPWRREFYIVPYIPATRLDPEEGGFDIEAHYRDGILYTDELPPDVDMQLTWLMEEYARSRADELKGRREDHYDRLYDSWKDEQMERASERKS